MVVLENTPECHNLVVCTFAPAILGRFSVCRRSGTNQRLTGRARSSIRAASCASLGSKSSENVEIRVWDSTSEMRYLVLPERPAGTEHMSEDELAALVTRDAMIGTAKVTLAGAAR